jgi:hypothetical protein
MPRHVVPGPAIPHFPAHSLRSPADARIAGGDDAPGMSTVLDTMVVTCEVPCGQLAELDLTVVGHTVAVMGPNGFRHHLELPEDADMSELTVELFKGFLELRAPRRAP